MKHDTSARNNCSVCKFFVETENGKGQCHLNPPTPQAIVVPRPSIQAGRPVPSLQIIAIWPTVKADDWCSRLELGLSTQRSQLS